MEAMSVETILLSPWEEEGLIGRTRVALDQSDVDVLAMSPNEGIVGVGETKVQRSPRAISMVSPGHVAAMRKGGEGLRSALGGDWFM
jgi:hypothetical protein